MLMTGGDVLLGHAPPICAGGPPLDGRIDRRNVDLVFSKSRKQNHKLCACDSRHRYSSPP
jgi:hypothetical protein